MTDHQVSDASRLAEELRTEQEHSQSVERGAKSTFAQCNELQQRLEVSNQLWLITHCIVIVRMPRPLLLVMDAR